MSHHTDTQAPIYSGCKTNGNRNTYMFWSNDTDLMVRVEVAMDWPPPNDRFIQTVATRHDIGDESWRDAGLTHEDLQYRTARDVATDLITAARGG